jgi:hypothetical protein
MDSFGASIANRDESISIFACLDSAAPVGIQVSEQSRLPSPQIPRHPCRLTVDFPTPPLPLPTAMTCVMPGSFSGPSAAWTDVVVE